MAKLPGLPLDEALLHPRLWVAEIVYFPLETALLAAARRIGCRTLDGGGMALRPSHQRSDRHALLRTFADLQRASRRCELFSEGVNDRRVNEQAIG